MSLCPVMFIPSIVSYLAYCIPSLSFCILRFVPPVTQFPVIFTPPISCFLARCALSLRASTAQPRRALSAVSKTKRWFSRGATQITKTGTAWTGKSRSTGCHSATSAERCGRVTTPRVSTSAARSSAISAPEGRRPTCLVRGYSDRMHTIDAVPVPAAYWNHD